MKERERERYQLCVCIVVLYFILFMRVAAITRLRKISRTLDDILVARRADDDDDGGNDATDADVVMLAR